MSVEEKRSTPTAFNRYVRQIRSQIIATGALILALVSQADATAKHDYKPGEFLIVDGGTSPDKKFSIVSGENKAGEFGVYLRDAHTKKSNRPLCIMSGLTLKGECELLPNDKSHVLNTQPVKEQKTKE